jgi:hypothetical protein
MATGARPISDSTTNHVRRARRWLAASVVIIALILVSAISSFSHSDENGDEQQASSPRFAFRDPKSKKYGFFNNRGAVVLEPIYDSALDFEEGLARVQQSGKAGYIGSTGALTFELPTGTGSTTRLSEGRIWFLAASNKWGLCDDQGVVIVEPKYDEVKPFAEGLAAVNIGARQQRRGMFPEGGKWGFVDKQGSVKIHVQFEYARSFSEGLAYVSDSRGPRFINKNGDAVINPASPRTGDFHEGVAALHVDRTGNGNYLTYFIDKAGKTEFTVQGYADEFHDGMAVVSVAGGAEKSDTNPYGFVNRKGKLAIPPRFGEAHAFREGLAAVRTRKTTVYRRGDTWGYIDKTGEYQIQPDFNEARPFRDGVAKVHIGGELHVVTDAPAYWKGGEWWLIDTRGRKLRRL